MTQEEKAKRYDEAIKLAKDSYNYPSYPGFIRADVVFPELKESEDERIRKGIIRNLEYLMDRAEGFVKGELKERIAWLEKQGEPKDINPSEFDLRLNKLLKQFETLPKEELVGSLSFWLNMVQNNGTYKAEGKQGEQPRYSIGDVLCDKSCTTLNKDAQSNFEITDIRNGMYICDKCSFPISQQDEYELVAKKVEQKHNEWSEEDEAKRNALIGLVEYINNQPLKRLEDWDGYISWLKSLNPQSHWKPTKEQMNTMKYLAKYYAKGCDEPTRSIIEGLYEQLKQL